jgi:hypothetical protein
MILTLILTIRLYVSYLPQSRGQWIGLMHDRNAHLLQSMVFALDLRYLDPVSFISDLNRARVYPPLFHMLAAPLLATGGFDYRLAALPSLIGWIGTTILVFLLTRQLAPAHRNAAAVLAALFVLRSPAYQAYATEIMLESLGAFLSLLTLYLYVSKREETDPKTGFTLLGCALTALFFLKYQYWFLTSAVLLLWEAISRYRVLSARLRVCWVRGDLQGLLMREVHHPLTRLLLGIIGIAGILLLTGGWKFVWAGQAIRVTASLNLAYACFLILCVRTALIWWRNEYEIRSSVGERGRQLLFCHLLPVAAWLLFPQKLQYFLRLLSPMNSSAGQRAAYWNWETLLFYPRAFVREYHDGASLALAAFVLALLAFVRVFRLSARARLVLLFLAVSAILTILHPNHQSRYLHPWIPVLWVAGAIGLASVLTLFGRVPVVGRAIPSGVLATLIVASAIKPLAFAFAERNSIEAVSGAATALDLSDYYLPRIGCYAHVSIFSTVPLYQFAWWTYLHRYPSQRGNLTVGLDRFGDSAVVNQMWFGEWLGHTSTQAIVFIDIPPRTLFYWQGEERYQQYRNLLQSQTLFREVERRVFPQYGSAVSILVRGEDDTSPLGCGYEQGSGKGSRRTFHKTSPSVPSKRIKPGGPSRLSPSFHFSKAVIGTARRGLPEVDRDWCGQDIRQPHFQRTHAHSLIFPPISVFPPNATSPHFPPPYTRTGIIGVKAQS